ncbi:4Fe-4S binding protein [Hahella ganghwensis]|uniref:4Fe-4S binding protein n=1 Tax=Hahella ganghwensis TaxID=286420 RepID=UPI000378F71E|nr:4Fe-4S binding protein [Hahella ganghwensis]
MTMEPIPVTCLDSQETGLLMRIGLWLRDHRGMVQKIQWGVVILYVGLVVTPAFLPLPDHYAHLWDNLTLFAQFLFWGIWWPFVLISMVLFGRLWCGVFCPEGTLSEWASRHGQGRSIPRWLRWPGWPLVAFIMTTVYGQMISVYQYPKAALLILGGSTIAAMAIGYFFGRNQRVWCRYLCPVSGVFSLLAKLSPLHFVSDADQWALYRKQFRQEYRQYQNHGLPKVQCPTFLPLKQLNSASPCHMCGRCAGHRDAIRLEARAPGSEITSGATEATRWDFLLIVFGLLGVAVGAFHWSASPWFVTLKQALALNLIESNWFWPLESYAPWWLLTYYPEQNDVFNLVDGVALLAYIAVTALVSGLVLSATLALSGRALGRWSTQRMYHLSLGLIPIAGAGVFLGLSALTISLLRAEQVPVFWAESVRGLILAGTGGWSLWLGWRITERYAGLRKRVTAMLGYALAVAWSVGVWWCLFFYW